ncbi:MAG: DHH family phosphoesterase, partial [Hyphomicrobiales bacterium]
MDQDSCFLGVEASVTGRRWRDRLSDERAALAIAQRHDLPEVLGRVLAARDVALDDVAKFMTPTLRDLMPPAAEMRDLDAGAERIAGAIMKGERVGIIGDYDVDGISSAALFRLFFRHLDREPVVHIPHRLDEGYGPNRATLDRFKADGVTLAVTVDCGITAHDPLDHAHDLGIDVVV